MQTPWNKAGTNSMERNWRKNIKKFSAMEYAFIRNGAGFWEKDTAERKTAEPHKTIKNKSKRSIRLWKQMNQKWYALLKMT